MATHLEEKLHKEGIRRVQIEGAGGSDWVLIDAGDIVVHLFKPEARALYALEKMWGAELDEPGGARSGGGPHRALMRLIAVGRLRQGPEAELFARYAARLRPALALTEIAEARGAPAEIKRREGRGDAGRAAGGRLRRRARSRRGGAGQRGARRAAGALGGGRRARRIS